MRKYSVLLVMLCISITGCAVVYSKNQFGIQDESAARVIEMHNHAADLRSMQKYAQLIRLLQDRLEKYTTNSYATSRIRNELAALYSYQVLDLETAVRIDRQILASPIPDQDVDANYLPTVRVAQQRILSDQAYISDYVSVNAAPLRSNSEERLARNLALLDGRILAKDGGLGSFSLKNHLIAVRGDIQSTPQGSASRKSILSRLIRAEYELMRFNDIDHLDSLGYVLSGELPLSGIDLSEIDFLSLADYFTRLFGKTGDIRVAEYALETVYRPYTNIRNPESRWKYNKIINVYISTLIDANYKLKRYDEMLYYISLNKSRMLLEERLAYGSKQNKNTKARLADLAADEGIPRDRNGLPEKSWFLNKLAATDRFLDFYVSGEYVTAKENRGAQVRHYADASAMPLTSRNVGVVQDDREEEVFDDTSMYITYIANGKAVVRKAVGQELESLRHELDKSYETMASRKSLPAIKAPSLSRLAEGLNLPQEFTVSPDKWLSKHPMDYHFNARTVRAVNFFTGADYGRLNDVKIAGFFNPTLMHGKGSLQGADQEADVIRKLAPTAKIIRREDAHLAALMKAGDANIIHLSMHGSFDPKDPLRSKLYFAGSRFELTPDDPNALYAENMSSYEALRGRDLIFAAACETGLAKADSANQSEQTGMIRSLTANRNRNVILSLWEVNDQATKEFVEAFYERLVIGKDITAAFRHAQGVVRQKYSHPKYWAAFYLSKS